MGGAEGGRAGEMAQTCTGRWMSDDAKASGRVSRDVM